jgi:glycosyltransferase involved in cell wall biosynthesis
VTLDPPENVGGIEGRALWYFRELRKRNIYVGIESLSPDGSFGTHYVGEVPVQTDSSNPMKAASSLANTRKIMVSRSIDSILLLSGAISVIGNLLLFQSRFTHRRTAILFYGKDIFSATRRPLSHLLLLASLFLTDKVLTNSRYTASLLPRFVRRKVSILYPGVDPASVSIAEHAEEPGHVVLFVGRLVKRKAADDVLNAFSVLLKETPDCRLEVVGDGPQRGKLEKLAADLGIWAQVSFLGTLRGKELYERLSACDFVVMPSRTLPDDVEGFGTVFLEAALCAKPAVGTRSGGIPEAVLDMSTGLLVPEGDVPELEKAMRRLISDRELRERLGEAARARVLQQFKWSDSASVLVRALS